MDLDNQWSYMKTHGDPGWEAFPSYLDVLIPQVLDILDRLDLKITFFIVGQDAALKKNEAALGQLTRRGHEVGNHSFRHEPWIHLYSRDQIKREILETEAQILRVTGEKPVGFRGPGYCWSPYLIKMLSKNSYIYDASTLPTYLSPVAKAYYFLKSDLSKQQKSERKKFFGSFKDGVRPIKPYYWKLDSGEKLLEIPVTTMPIIRLPFHLSYLTYIGRSSSKLMLLYLNTGLLLCRLMGVEPSFILHPLDLLGGDQIPELAFFPGMELSTEQKRELFNTVMKILSQQFEIVGVRTFAESVLKHDRLRCLSYA
jgi:hypothetical protein